MPPTARHASARFVRRAAALTLALALGWSAGGCALFRDGVASPLPDAAERDRASREARSAEEAAKRPPGEPLFRGASEPVRKQTPSLAALRAKLGALLDHPDLAGTSHGVHVLSLARGDVVFSRNADLLLRPASCHKLFTTAAALELLGPDFAFSTPFVATGKFDAATGRLDGALVVEGRGDPSLSGRYDLSGKSTAALLDEWADAVWRSGIREIAGGVVADGSFFPSPGANPTWEVDDLDYSYAAPASALSINDNCVDIVVRPAAVAGEPADVVLSPPGAELYVSVLGGVATVAAGEKTEPVIRRRLGENTLELSGGIAVGAKPVETWRSIVDGDAWSAHLIREALLRRGAKVEGPASTLAALGEAEREALAASPRKTLFERESPPLHQLVAVINKPSQNQHAEMLLRVVGWKAKGSATTESGAKALEELIAGTGASSAGFVSADGSGLSWRDLSTARQIARALAYMASRATAAQFYNSLPVAGVDGTLELRFPDGPARGNARAKTGYISKTRSMCGYVATRGGERLAFAIVTNNYPGPTSRTNALHDAIANALAGWDGE